MRKAVIMAGGFGTRLRPLTMSIPKPMVPLANRPMMGHIVELLKAHGIHDVVSVLYFNPEQITSFFRDGSAFDISMEYTTAVADFGTAGAVKNAQAFLDETFIIISGDVLTDFDISKAVAFHREKKAMATILLTRVPEPLQYGIVMTDREGRITRFLEKPSWGEVFSDTINTGIYILEPSVLDLIPPQTEFDFSKDLYPLMLKKGLPLYGFIAEGYWKDIGNLHEYQLAHDDVLGGKVAVSTAVNDDGVVLGDNVRLGSNVSLKNCVIGDSCVIGDGAVISNSVIWNNTVIGEFAEITHAVICNSVRIGSHVVIHDNVFVAEDCVIGDHARLLSNIKLWPRKHVESHATVTRSLVQEERWSRELFTDARISGVANIDMNPEFGAKLGAALGNAVGSHMMLVASRDADPVSRIMKRSITAGLMSVGCDVTDLQQTSIPQTRQEMLSGRFVAGFHIRRSPRDPNKTDIILFAKDGRDIPLSMTKSIERFFYGEDIKRVPQAEVGQLRFPERSIEQYVNRFLEMIDVNLVSNRSFKLLADYSFGLSSTVFPSILGELHCKVLSMNNYVDASHFADPLTDVLDESATIMRSLGYELGFKIDPSSEKIAMVDERGIWYTGLRLLTIVTKLWLDTHRHLEPYTIAVPVQATTEIDQIAAEYNVNVVRIKNSHGAMMEATKDENVQFVGGTRGGFIFPRFLFAADGMYSACQILEMLAKTGYQLSDLDRKLPKRFQRTVGVHCPWESKGTVMRRTMEHSEDKQRQLIDGVKIFLGNASVLLVPDKEGPIFTVTAEAGDEAEAQRLMDQYAHLVAQWRDGN
ncbi:MAG: NTP transferase domain-containing protein [Bacteroidetes bacterium]|nr:NTP transferase domain-containing protein [Bacteroidota bacterium]